MHYEQIVGDLGHQRRNKKKTPRDKWRLKHILLELLGCSQGHPKRKDYCR